MKPHLETQFIGWYDAYADALFRHCLFRVFDRERARELMQETFTRAWEYACAGHEIQQPRALLYRIANNAIIDNARRRATAPATSLDELLEHGAPLAAPHTGSAKEHLQQVAATDDVRLLLAELPQDQRELLLLRHVEGLGPKEIAAVLGETPNVISVRLHRAAAAARELLKEK